MTIFSARETGHSPSGSRLTWGMARTGPEARARIERDARQPTTVRRALVPHAMRHLGDESQLSFLGCLADWIATHPGIEPALR